MKRLMIIFFALILCKSESKNAPTIESFRNTWYKISIKGMKVGYSVKGIKKVDSGVVLYEKSMMDLNLLGKPETLFTENSATLDREFNLLNFVFNLNAGDYHTEITGEVKKGILYARVKTGGIERESRMKYRKKLTTLNAIPFLITTMGKGSKREMEIFDPMLFSVLPVRIEIRNVKQDTIKADVFIQNLHYEIISLKDGTLLSQFEPPFVKTEISSEEEALKYVPPEKKIDILTMFAIPCDGRIDNPRELRHLKIEIENMGNEPLKMEDDFQKIISRKPFILEISSPMPERGVKVIDGEDYLKSTQYIQSDAPEIKSAVKEICGGITDPVEKVIKIKEWVFKNLRKNPTASIPSAVDILREREGDCNEHSILFAALSRAAGIPSKVVVGVVYLNGGFYYHAWNAVMLGGKWYPVDPTFNQFPADATHIKMEEGELKNQAKVLSIVGNIRIKILK